MLLFQAFKSHSVVLSEHKKNACKHTNKSVKFSVIWIYQCENNQ